MEVLNTYRNYLVVREFDGNKYKCRVFLKIDENRPPVHVSSLRNHGLVETIFENGRVEYTIDINALRQPLEAYVFSTGPAGPRITVYRVLGSQVSEESTGVWDVRVSSGFPRVDDAVEETTAYRRKWCDVFCGGYGGVVAFYEALLKARIGLNYALFRRIKDVWVEQSNEYLGFVYSLIHSLLLEKGCNVEYGGEKLRSICESVFSSSSVDWRGVDVVYRCPSQRTMVFLERMIGASKPDILLVVGDRQVVVECKQGAPRTWISKAIKQASKYKRYADLLVLVTSRRLHREDYEELSRHYDYVVEECTMRNALLCGILVGKVLEGKPGYPL